MITEIGDKSSYYQTSSIPEQDRVYFTFTPSIVPNHKQSTSNYKSTIQKDILSTQLVAAVEDSLACHSSKQSKLQRVVLKKRKISTHGYVFCSFLPTKKVACALAMNRTLFVAKNNHGF